MKKERSEAQSIVFVVDDDASVRQALQSLLRSVGLQAETFGSTAEFLSAKLPDVASCLVLDVRLPGVSGLDFQSELAKAKICIPIIFITGHGDIPMSVRAMKAGAVEFLAKPFRDQDMLDAVQVGLERDRERRKSAIDSSKLKASFYALTPREQEILALLARGAMYKEISNSLGISLNTVRMHLKHIYEKLHVQSRTEAALKFVSGK